MSLEQSQSKAAVSPTAKQVQNLNLEITSEMIEPVIKSIERAKELLNYSNEQQWSDEELLATVNFLHAALNSKE